MSIPGWMRQSWVKWFSVIVVTVFLHSISQISRDQWRGRKIVREAGLPPLPSRAWIKYAHVESHEFLFEDVAVGFTAPPAQIDEWMKAADDWKAERAPSGTSVLSHTIRKRDMTPGVDFSATLSYK